MSFAAVVIEPWLLICCAVLSLAVLGRAAWLFPWQRLEKDRPLQHRLLGATLFVALLWQLRAQAVDWLTLHLLLTVLLTLVFTAPLALLANALVNVAMIMLGKVAWPLLGVNVLVTGVVPALVTVGLWRLVDRRLPDNLFVYLFVCGFFGAALATLMSGLCTVGLVLVGATSPEVLRLVHDHALFLPLLMPSEAFITGMLLSLLLVYHPHWVMTFDSHRYIDTK
ncbi:energy-coupling factor ABC transporter permease [Halomonas sp. McH1-25]|uniref:energy-coupling factor ABC transporter permease n=1 Tax=unclassified Halomonas TaxID=2609666 RepID=UPI001EF4CCFC|nr:MULTISPECIES: energy-coupling factor ABC transporter permease [unclassified Halomonas]MCG7598715.1 energy-coupling factor ABC transporter permease [Halomonas sp. McH1-25]MCP1340678.1 energy-coupling factor ABC transporter permease [Halomonas sp. FL8]MCP1359449.1 energy-coupling factor ABC transporter permease [Halomonas sp. BBD45]MCP1366021.1 energy-coupling factor ABC transporter permease [Halomonas sp. BBD48]